MLYDERDIRQSQALDIAQKMAAATANCERVALRQSSRIKLSATLRSFLKSMMAR